MLLYIIRNDIINENEAAKMCIFHDDEKSLCVDTQLKACVIHACIDNINNNANMSILRCNAQKYAKLRIFTHFLAQMWQV